MENACVFRNKLKQRRAMIGYVGQKPLGAPCCPSLRGAVADKRSVRRPNTDQKLSVKDGVTGRYRYNNVRFASVNSAICRSYSGRIEDDQMLAVGSAMSKLVVRSVVVGWR